MVRTGEEIRHIKLPRGGVLELTIMPGFYDCIRSHFNIGNDELVDDDHIRMFVFGTLKSAVDKAEEDVA